jgi:hypothetical protein
MKKSNGYEEDIAVVAPGTVINAGPCVIANMTVCIEDSAVVVVNFSDSATAYDNAERKLKVVLNGPTTVHLNFEGGKNFDNGLCAIANNGSADVAITYE